MNFLAYAMGGGGGGASETGGFQVLLLPMALIAIFYFILIRPQQKKAKEHRALLSALKKGDRVVSAGGLYGVITGLTDDVVTIEIAPKVRVKISRASISGVIGKSTEKLPAE